MIQLRRPPHNHLSKVDRSVNHWQAPTRLGSNLAVTLTINGQKAGFRNASRPWPVVLQNHLLPFMRDGYDFRGARSQEPACLDESFIDRIMRLKLAPRPRTVGPRGPKRGREPATWLVQLHEINPDRPEDEERGIARGRTRAEALARDPEKIDWMRFGASARMAFLREACQGDRIIVVWRPRSGSRQALRDRIYLDEERGDGWRFIHYDYVDDRPLPFARFRSIWKSITGKEPRGGLIPPDVAERLMWEWDRVAGRNRPSSVTSASRPGREAAGKVGNKISWSRGAHSYRI